MRKINLAFTIATVTAILLISITSSIRTTAAANGEDYSITYVSHNIAIMSNGYIFINDTIQLSGQASNGFLIGFPYKYGSHVIQCAAYNSTDVFPVSLNVPLESHVGFYGVKIFFPQKTPQTFTVGFVLSNNLLKQYATNTSIYTLDFPAHPSFTKNATVSNASIVLEGAQYMSGTVTGLKYQEENLSAFSYQPANVSFLLADAGIQIIDMKELKREIRVNEQGSIEGADNYHITNKGPTGTKSIEVTLPLNASNPSAQDQFGRNLPGSSFVNEKKGVYKVGLTLSLESGKFTRFTVKYQLPSQLYINTQEGTEVLNPTALLFRKINYYVEQASLSIVLPEGARITSFGNYSITRDVFNEILTTNRGDVSVIDDLLPLEAPAQIMYEYNPLWSSFRPTLWIWVTAIVGCAAVFIWKRPKAPAPVPVSVAAVRLHPDHLKFFIDAYEEKRKIMREIASLEDRAQKGKIPRRRYKVQRTTSETRLNTLARSLMELKERMRAAGGHYVELMRQLEIAETDITEAEASIKSIEARHGRGELSIEAYRKLLSDYERRKERANTTIDGIIIRLREETR